MKPYSERVLNENISVRKFSRNVSQDQLVWHRDREDRTIVVVEGSGWKFQRDNHLPESVSAGDKISVSAGEYHRLIKGSTNLIVTIIKEAKDQNDDGENDFDDVRIARMKASGMSDEEIKKKHPELFEEYLNEKRKRRRKRKKKKKTDFHKGGEKSYRQGRSQKQLSKQISLTRAYNKATTEKEKQRIRKKIDKSRERERASESATTRIDLDTLREYIEEVVEEQKLYAALEEAAAIEDAEEEALYELEDLDEKRKRKRKKKKKSGSRTLSKAVKKSLDKKADRRCLTRGSVYAEFRAGLGAYYSSGSRKGMSAHQWAHARVNSANPSKKWAKVKKRKKCPKKKK